MKCSDDTRCKNFDILKIDDTYFCRNCNSNFKNKKLFKCCKKQKMNFNTNIPYCFNCKIIQYDIKNHKTPKSTVGNICLIAIIVV